jgi:hypothetical protein
VLVFRWSWMPYRGLDASVVGWLPFLRFLRAASSSRMHWRADRTRSAAGGEPFRREAQRQQHPRAISSSLRGGWRPRVPRAPSMPSKPGRAASRAPRAPVTGRCTS